VVGVASAINCLGADCNRRSSCWRLQRKLAGVLGAMLKSGICGVNLLPCKHPTVALCSVCDGERAKVERAFTAGSP
jgi:hypothetical protein